MTQHGMSSAMFYNTNNDTDVDLVPFGISEKQKMVSMCL